MLRILLVRHGQSEGDIKKRHEGRANFPLTDKGEFQAALVASYLKEKYDIKEIYCSPLKRAYSTAEKIGSEFRLELNVMDELMERDNGLLAGMSFEEAKERFPMPRNERKVYDPIPGGESVIDFRMRIEKIWTRFIDEKYDVNEEKTICIVAHGGTISFLNQAILNLPIDNGIVFPTGDTGFHEWIFKGKDKIMLRMNCQEHLLKDDYVKYESVDIS